MNAITLTPSKYQVSLTTKSGVLRLTSDASFIRLALMQVVEIYTGPVSGDKTYRHVQGVASATWAVTHNLEKYPAVSVMDSGGSLVEGDIDYLDENNVVLSFTAAFSGEANFN